MSARGTADEQQEDVRPVVYCVVPRELAAKLHEPLRRHFRDDPGVEVIVERRNRERRRASERRSPDGPARRADRRMIRAVAGRRAGDRRAALVPVAAPALPRRARAYADRLSFVERLEPSGERAEDLDSARLVGRFQTGDSEAFSTLYQRYFQRVYSYLRVVLNDPHGAEDATQQVFMQVFESLPRYERREQPFRSWLFAVVRNRAVDHLRTNDRLEIVDPAELGRRRERAAPEEPEPPALDWLTDRELLIFVERLPLVQRQVLLLRYLLGLPTDQVAHVLHRTPTDVRTLQSRALRFLRERLTAIGRGPERRDRSRMRRWPKAAPVLQQRRFALYR